MANNLHNDLFSSLVSDIKNYTGKDPLLPWLQGIRKMRESLPSQLLKEKLPRFLQKCAQTFEKDQCYRNDLRYIRVWIQLMDFVDDPRALLRTMERNRIGRKKVLFYQAYALYYEKLKKFEEAEKMYHLGVQNLAEPAEELQKSYEQFLRRMAQYKKRKIRRQELRASMASRSILSHNQEMEETKEDICRVKGGPTGTYSMVSLSSPDHYTNVETKTVMGESSMDMTRGKPDYEAHLPANQGRISVNSSGVGIVSDPCGTKEVMGAVGPRSSFKQQESTDMESNQPTTVCNDETVVVKFVDTAIVGKSEAEDACHHGLVDPTINLKEAMNAINSMFREPLELEPVYRRKSQRSQAKVDQRASNGFEVFVDESNGLGFSDQNKENGDVPTISGFVKPKNPALSKKHKTEPPQETFQIFVDDEDDNDCGDGNDALGVVDAFVFPRPNDLPSNGSDDQDMKSSPNMKPREDTVVCRFVGSAIVDEPEVENACHHGLVDPTINLKEAMDAINSMFGKPLDFVKTNRLKKQSKFIDKKRDRDQFSILPDEDLENRPPQASSHLSSKFGSECDLFEPTVFTKEAMDDINEMFGKPLDF